jgi:hypothetical protein
MKLQTFQCGRTILVVFTDKNDVKLRFRLTVRAAKALSLSLGQHFQPVLQPVGLPRLDLR